MEQTQSYLDVAKSGFVGLANEAFNRANPLETGKSTDLALTIFSRGDDDVPGGPGFFDYAKMVGNIATRAGIDPGHEEPYLYLQRKNKGNNPSVIKLRDLYIREVMNWMQVQLDEITKLPPGGKTMIPCLEKFPNLASAELNTDDFWDPDVCVVWGEFRARVYFDPNEKVYLFYFNNKRYMEFTTGQTKKVWYGATLNAKRGEVRKLIKIFHDYAEALLV